MAYEALDLSLFAAAPPPTFDYVLPGLLRGTVGMLVGPGGISKSFWCLQAALDIANSNPSSAVKLTGLKPTKGVVAYFGAEDPANVVHSRIHNIAKIAPKNMSYSNLRYYKIKADIELDADFQEMKTAATGASLIILDTLSRFHCRDENSATDMKPVLARLELLAEATNAAVLVVHHSSKAAVLAGLATMPQGARGTSLLTDNLRWVSYLAPMSEAECKTFNVSEGAPFVRWNISKQNYGAAMLDYWYQRNQDGVLIPIASPSAQADSEPPAMTAMPVAVTKKIAGATRAARPASHDANVSLRSGAFTPAQRQGYPSGGSNQKDW